MREVTKLLINDFKIKELGYDFMGYALQKGDIYTFHHLLIANRDGGPYDYWNGVVLLSTPHQYLHTIEAVNYKYFTYLTSEMQDMKIKGYLDSYNLEEINNILCEFEHKYRNYYTKKHKKLLRPEYMHRVFKK